MRAARTATSLLCTVALAVGAAGCGGSKVDYQEVPGPPADVTIPSDTGSLGDSASGDATPTPTPTATAEPGGTTAPDTQSGSTGTTPSTGTDSGTTGTTGTSGTDSGGASAPTQQDSASNDTAPPAGSDAQQFEDFCAQNPGAC
jgi:hypothetical protein